MTITTPGLAEAAAKKIGGIITTTGGSLSVVYYLHRVEPHVLSTPRVFPISAMTSADALAAIHIEEDENGCADTGMPETTDLTVGGVLSVSDSDTVVTDWGLEYGDFYYNLTFVDGS